MARPDEKSQHPMTDNGIRIAMWSGPRNLSTALMRSWGNRNDTYVCDEPFYAYFLKETGIAHPSAEEVIGAYETDPRKIVSWLTGAIPQGKQIFYQKQITHHILPELSLDWLPALSHCFLIRAPRDMLTSLLRILPAPTLRDTGLPQQLRLFELIREQTGRIPPVLDSADILKSPKKMLQRLCEALQVPFCEDMLSWPAGRRDTDGLWARHWYSSVEKSTGFVPFRPKNEDLPSRLMGLLRQIEPLYGQLYEHRLTC